MGDFLPQSTVAVSKSLVILEILRTVTLSSSQKTRMTECSVVFYRNLVNVVETLFCQVNFHLLKIPFHSQSKVIFFCQVSYYSKLYNQSLYILF